MKSVGLLVVALFVAVIGYPILHEFGHSIAAVLVGAKLIEFNLLPLPYVVLDVREVNVNKQAIIGLSGVMFPLGLVTFVKTRKFWIWYTTFLVKGISLYAIMVSLICAILYVNGIGIEMEDFVQVLKFYPNNECLCIVLLSSVLVYVMFVIKKEKPLSRCLNYFEVNNNASGRLFDKGRDGL
ncbi:MAG: hypothetical protein IJD93_00645 [Ruminococcus sp.]|nr:hypothetical protein [Ruminococcus sp.]